LRKSLRARFFFSCLINQIDVQCFSRTEIYGFSSKIWVEVHDTLLHDTDKPYVCYLIYKFLKVRASILMLFTWCHGVPQITQESYMTPGYTDISLMKIPDKGCHWSGLDQYPYIPMYIKIRASLFHIFPKSQGVPVEYYLPYWWVTWIHNGILLLKQSHTELLTLNPFEADEHCLRNFVDAKWTYRGIASSKCRIEMWQMKEMQP
jgi:hypothetical protein